MKPVSQRTLTRSVTSSASSSRSASTRRQPVGAVHGRAHRSSSSFRRTRAVAVAVDALALDGRDAEVADDRHAAELLARVHVGEVDLDGGQRGDLQRVADRPRVVRPRARVDDDAVGEALDAVQVLDELALVVGLKEPRLQIELAREGADLLLELIEGQRAVVRGRAPPEHVEVDAVQDVDAVARAHEAVNSRTASDDVVVGRRPGPCTTSPAPRTSTNGVRAVVVRFLSSRVAATIASGSTSCLQARRQPGGGQQLLDLAAQVRRAAQPQRGEQAEADGLAVAQRAVAERRSPARGRRCGRG